MKPPASTVNPRLALMKLKIKARGDDKAVPAQHRWYFRLYYPNGQSMESGGGVESAPIFVHKVGTGLQSARFRS